ncbi:unnamed protein product, partial [Mesorhabditis spiculigera]
MRCGFRLLFIGFFLLASIKLLYFLTTRDLKIMEIDTLGGKAAGNSLKNVAVFPQSGGSTKFDQPWPLPEKPIIKRIEDLYKLGDYLLVGNFSYSKGLGNLMFQYAAMVGLAQETHAIFPISSDNLLRRAFDLNAILVTPELHDNLLKLAEGTVLESCCSYKALDLGFTVFRSVKKVEGYFQNFRWFYPGEASKLVRDEFQFLPKIQELASEHLEHAKARWRLGRAEAANRDKENAENDYKLRFSTETADPVTVAVHVRRGLDLTMHSRNLKHGHVAAPADYYERAMYEFQRQYPNPLFIVSSDDVGWAMKNLKARNSGEIYYLPRGTEREVAMATMSICDHLIASTGTFSWWTAFLADDERNQIIYYKDWPRPLTDLDRMVNKSEYFLPRWRGL